MKTIKPSSNSPFPRGGRIAKPLHGICAPLSFGVGEGLAIPLLCEGVGVSPVSTLPSLGRGGGWAYFRFGFILLHSLIGGMMPRSMTS